MLQLNKSSSSCWLSGIWSLGLALLLTCQALAANRLISVHDGDTFRIQQDGQVVKVRLWGVDTPEIDQAQGKDAKAFTERLLKAGTIELDCIGESYDRKTCHVKAGGKDLALELVKSGWAWDSPAYSKCKYKAPQQVAKANKLGVWGNPESISPYCFRWLGKPQCEANPHYMP
jgi:micrococcal nuclease